MAIRTLEGAAMRKPALIKKAVTAGLTIRELPTSERPRERFMALGPEAVSEQELLCCVLGRGIAGESVLVTAQRLLSAFGDVRGIVEASIEQLVAIHGVGMAKAVQLKAAGELARRFARADARTLKTIDSAEAAAALVRPMLLDKKKEHVVAVLLDNRHRLIRISLVAVGSLSASLIHPRELFKEAVMASAAAMIVAHNHPSGDPNPSEHDLVLTKRLVQAGKLVGIEVLDHLIVGTEGFVSLNAMGMIR